MSRPTDLTTDTRETSRRELLSFLRPIYGGRVESLDFQLTVDPALPVGESRVEATPSGCAFAGRTPTETLHGVYCYLEELGYRFTVTGASPPRRVLQSLPNLSRAYAARLHKRGIRQHINFPMDISGYPVWEAKEYIRDLARMKLNQIGFHLYSSCGWYHLTMPEVGDAFADRPGRIHDYTFFYSEYHPVSDDPLIRAGVRNHAHFCAPEIEPVYGTGAARPLQYRFLQDLIHEAKLYGLHVIVSTDTFGNNLRDLFPNAEGWDRELWVRASTEALHHMAQLYSEADEYELISPENSQLPSDDWAAACRERLSRLLPGHTVPQIDGLIALAEPASVGEREGYLQVLDSIDIAVEAFARAEADSELGPALEGKQLTIALYNGMSGVSQACARALMAGVPERYKTAWICAHGADNVSRNLASMELPPDDLARLRIYSWVEVDGWMWTMQFPMSGLTSNVEHGAGDEPGQGHTRGLPDARLSQSPSSQSQGVLFHHWRNAENELGLLWAAHAAFEGVTADSFARETLVPLWGLPASEGAQRTVVSLLGALEAVGNAGSDHGFCYLACWWDVDADKSMSAVAGGSVAANENRKKLAQAAIDLTEALIAESERPDGIARLRNLRSFLLATKAHHDAATAMTAMATYLRSIDRNNMTDEQRAEFCRLGDVALGHADRWVETMCGAIADRGVEGNIISYDHVVRGYIRGFLGLYGGVPHEPMPEYAVPAGLQAPTPML